jgi:hypothetical protein
VLPRRNRCISVTRSTVVRFPDGEVRPSDDRIGRGIRLAPSRSAGSGAGADAREGIVRASRSARPQCLGRPLGDRISFVAGRCCQRALPRAARRQERWQPSARHRQDLSNRSSAPGICVLRRSFTESGPGTAGARRMDFDNWGAVRRGLHAAPGPRAVRLGSLPLHSLSRPHGLFG